MSDASSNISATPKQSGDSVPSKPARKYYWSPMAAVAWVLVGFTIFPVIASVFITFVPHALGWESVRADTWIMEAPLANFLYVLLSEVLTVGALAWFIAHRKASFREVMGLRRPVLSDVGYAIAGIVVYFVLFIVALLVAQQFFSINSDQKQALGFEQGISGNGLILAFISLVILPPIAEELIFRGFFFGTLRGHKMNLAWSMFTTSIVFGALHLFGAADNNLLWIAALDTFVLSLVLCYVREKTGGIWASILVHALKNGFVFLNLFIINVT
ncbi:MAG: CPBP family intramembrane glutamic endopeptidase [Candidatus Saccharimonadales bacterium]